MQLCYWTTYFTTQAQKNEARSQQMLQAKLVPWLGVALPYQLQSVAGE
jgi:hypothetical protein